MEYYTAVNYGKGFITYEDNERSYIQEYPGQVYVTENNQIWADRVGAVTKTKLEAQTIVDAALAEALTQWEACTSGSYPWMCGPRPEPIILP